MKILISILIFFGLAFGNTQNVSLMNNIKDVIQKEEYIALAINKYIAQTGKIPKKNDNTLDWQKLETAEYLGTNFNKTNPITSKEIKIVFDTTENKKNSAYILGVIEQQSEYKKEYDYLYNFYTNKVFRVNTIPPTNITKEKLVLGSQILYNDIQKEIVSVLNETNPKDIKLSNQVKDCIANKYFYELINGRLIYRYCKADNSSIEVYQKEPIYSENQDDLDYIITDIGAKAYVRIGTPAAWYEKYFIGIGTNGKSVWSDSETTGSNNNEPVEVGDSQNIQDILLSYIPNSKDLMLRRDGGCMLANGDIFCWGNNQYKKVGVENYGQLDTNLKPYFVNTPVMLKVQINDTTQNDIKWYNNPYRVKFQKMAMNSLNVCAVSPIFVSSSTKTGGDLYCNGKITSTTFENIAAASSETAILSRNKYFANKTNGVYLKDIAMVEDTMAFLSDNGKIYTFGKNYLGALGIGSDDKFIIQANPVEVANSGQKFIKIFALRDIKTFGAIDENNEFYIWGERPNGTTYNKPTLLASGKKFNPDAIFTNSKEFLLKGADGVFYRTNNDLSVTSVNSDIPSTAISASIYDHSNGTTSYIYADNKMELKGSTSFMSCKESGGANCNTTDNTIFNTSLNELNTISDITAYANFANVSIYQLDTVKTEQLDTFESNTTGWKLKKYSDTQFKNLSSTTTSVPTYVATESSPDTSVLSITERVNPTRIAGRFLIAKESLEKTYTFGSAYANNEVEVELDFYEIDSWDMERFQIFLNDVLVAEDGFIHDEHEQWTETNDTGIYTLNLGTHYNGGIITVNGVKYSKFNDEKYTYKLKGKLDNSGNLKVEFRVRELKSGDYGYNSWAYGQELSDESWGVDNVHVKVKETSKTFVCTMTGVDSASQMYCWGNVGRSIPILSTSLYDVSKISTINKLFISQEGDKTTQMSFDKYNNDGNLFLKYPTYIGGFDYPFYFK